MQPAIDPTNLQAIVIGASAGAVEALLALIPALPADFPLPIVIVVHLPADKASVLPQLLDAKSPLSVREAEDKEPLERGRVYIAPPDYHVLIEHDRRLSLSGEEPVLYSRPSIDVLFETTADAFGPGVLGIVLSGANSDGAKGLKAICDAGGQAIVQNPKTAQASTMPAAALKLCPTAVVLDLAQIAAFLAMLQLTPDAD